MLTQGRHVRLRRKERKPMSRETEWQQLQEIREEILAIYGEMDACRAQMVDQLNSIGNILYYDLHF